MTSIFDDNRCLWCYLGGKNHDPFGVISLKLNNIESIWLGVILCSFKFVVVLFNLLLVLALSDF